MFSQTVIIALCTWLPVVYFIFRKLPADAAVIAAYVLGTLFLPVFELKLSGFPTLNKPEVVSIVVLVVAFFLYLRPMVSWHLTRMDIPILLYCLSGGISSLTNDLGWNDAYQSTLARLLCWGAPYFLAKIFCAKPSSNQKLTLWIFIGGLLYVPLCIFELRMSPQLHNMFYGYHAHPDFGQNIRFGGYRPVAFMQHGLALSLWMAMASLAGIALYRAEVFPKHWGRAREGLILCLLVITILTKSSLAVALFIGLSLILILSSKIRSSFLLIVLACLPPLYIFSRTTGIWSGESLVNVTSSMLSGDRAQSLDFRLMNENLLIQKAFDRPLFGWGGFGRAEVLSEEMQKVVTTWDGMWMITFGESGLFGLVTLFTTLLAPVILFLKSVDVDSWTTRESAPQVMMALLLTGFAIDCLFNAMFNPVYILAAGALTAGLEQRESR